MSCSIWHPNTPADPKWNSTLQYSNSFDTMPLTVVSDCDADADADVRPKITLDVVENVLDDDTDEKCQDSDEPQSGLSVAKVTKSPVKQETGFEGKMFSPIIFDFRLIVLAPPPSVVSFSDDDEDDVSLLYDDPDMDGRGLPSSTFLVLDSMFENEVEYEESVCTEEAD